MATPFLWRRLRWRGGDRHRRLKAGLIATVVAPLAILALASAALARPGAPPPSLGLLPSALPSVCVGGVLLCDTRPVNLPTALPLPVPSVCVGPACPGQVTGSATPGANRPPVTSGPAPGGRPPTGSAGAPRTGSGGAGSVAAAAPLPAPPGVGLVPAPAATDGHNSLNPDAFATVLSLSLRDGVGAAAYHLWPWLLAIQLLLWAAIAGVAWSRLVSSARPRRG